MFDEDRKYSLNRIIRLMSGFPEDRPLPCRYEHGHPFADDKPINDLRTKKRLMLVFSKRRLNTWQKYSKKKAVIIGSPFVQYRRLKNICKVENPTGTIAYPLHSTKKDVSIYSRQEYCEQLTQLPKEFQPVKVCVHEHDIHHGYDEVYKKHGFEVVTAGVREEPDFVDKFYGLLRQCKYATSNAFGSYLFYAVEMGVPFFIYGPEATIKHLNKKGIPDRPFDFKDCQFGDSIVNLFSTYPNVQITEEQNLAVEQEVGINDAVDGKELYRLLMENYWRQRLEDAVHFPFRHPKKFFQRMFRRLSLNK